MAVPNGISYSSIESELDFSDIEAKYAAIYPPVEKILTAGQISR